MASNQAQVAVLESRPVPQDMQCILPQELADAIAQYVRVAGLASQISSPEGVSTPITNNIGQQALALAQTNETNITALQGQLVERRVVARRTNVNTGDSVQDFAISPEMSTSDYIVMLEYEGAVSHPAAYYGWRVVTSSKTTTGFQVSFDNTPANTVVTVIVEGMTSVEL